MADHSKDHDGAAANGGWGRVQPESRLQLERFARGAAGHFQNAPRHRSMIWDRWDRDSDGVFRRRDRAIGWRWNLFDDLESVPDYEEVSDALRDDPCIGPQLDMLIGTGMASSRIELASVIRGIVNESWGKTRRPSFDERRFASAFEKWRIFFEATRIPVRLVAVLPGATIDDGEPLVVDGDELVIDRLIDAEVAAALSTGLAGLFPADSSIFQGDLIGVRRICWLAKTVSDGALDTPVLEGDGEFGRRPMVRLDLFGDDVATLLRLYSSGRVVVSGGFLLRTELGGRGVSWHVRQRPSNAYGDLRLNTSDLSPLQDLWADLRRNAASRRRPPPIAFSRFASAFDRATLQDRLIDLMIAAEAIFLQEDGSPEDRGELSFRLALRAAHFITDPARDKAAIFDEMKKAYALRSRLVHGATHETTPSNVDPVADLLRRGLVQALEASRRGDTFGTSRYWKNLLLG